MIFSPCIRKRSYSVHYMRRDEFQLRHVFESTRVHNIKILHVEYRHRIVINIMFNNFIEFRYGVRFVPTHIMFFFILLTAFQTYTTKHNGTKRVTENLHANKQKKGVKIVLCEAVRGSFFYILWWMNKDVNVCGSTSFNNFFFLMSTNKNFECRLIASFYENILICLTLGLFEISM